MTDAAIKTRLQVRIRRILAVALMVAGFSAPPRAG